MPRPRKGDRLPWQPWLPVETRWAIYRRDKFTCQICDELVSLRGRIGTPDRATLDHIQPRSHGGTDDVDNLRLVCHSCNAWRGNRRPASEKRVKPCPT